MLFGVKLQNEIYPPWKDYYIDYEQLKKLLKENVVLSMNPWSDKDESAFVAKLDSELEKVFNFQEEQYKILDEEISKLEKDSENYLSNNNYKFDLRDFQLHLEKLLAHAQELDHFARLNFTGFLKIVKKHDRLHKKYSVKALLSVRMKDLPFHSEDYSPYLYRLSILYQFLRENFESESLSRSLNNSVSKLSTSGKLSSTPTIDSSANNTFKVLKFWVHPDNLMEIKTTILRHLPVLIYNNSEDDYDEVVNDPTITSLYFDSNEFELYNSKLLKNLNNTPSFRIRWTGKLQDNQELILEQKNFNYDTGESNDVKLSLKEKYINDFIFADNTDTGFQDDDELNFSSPNKNKKFTFERYAKKLSKRNLPQEILNKYEGDFKHLQRFIKDNDLQPTLRTIYTRTAFQIPGDDKIRIIIDSDILFIREDSFDKDRPIRDPKQWHRADIDQPGLKEPYSLLRKGEYSKFPYAVMEIKVSNSILSNKNSKTFKWINELTNSHLVREVPNFSKFIQGVASLFLESDNLDILPFWLSDLERDIRKKPEEAYRDSIMRIEKMKKENSNLKILKKQKVGNNNSTTYLGNIEELVENDENSNKKNDEPNAQDNGDLDLEDHESSDEEDQEAAAHASSSADAANANATTTASGFDQQKSKNINKKSKGNKPKLSIPFFIDHNNTYSTTYDESEDETEPILPPGVTKPKQLLRQSGPLKIEPKVYLANERTLLSWDRVVTYMAFLTIALTNSLKSSNFQTLSWYLSYFYLVLTIFVGCWGY
ncbi:hypothetical protein PACTADRAFT_34155 [Pachysolen tannophilus NRRL Y-2460]|uniref:SPX domain-containing protein n=1 Tax=Pachysolen tannophilus NRRL Y-2460 TaxID=669874 RepID=A0A1E4TV34_PACTA|nr:hypothetical protein PACTADRAFT_34155 [Pachysolen tannophilus NRRL Y-2460]